MQAIQISAINGYKFYISGKVHIEKLPKFIQKIKRQYSPNEPRYKAFRERAKGNASYKFYCGVSTDSEYIDWILMFTEGKNIVKNERICSIELKKDRYLYDRYALIKSPLKSNGRTSFTWKIEESYYKGHEMQIKDTVRTLKTAQIEHMVENISKYLPGFSGIRKQKAELNKLLKNEIKRQGKALQYLKVKKIDNWTLRRIPWEQVTNTKVFVENLKKHDRTIHEQISIYKKNKQKRGRTLSKKGVA